MTDDSENESLDPGFVQRLRELSPDPPVPDGETLDEMFANVQGRCNQADSTFAGYVRSRSTMVRRMIVLGVFGVLGVLGWIMFPLVDESAQSVQWASTLLVFCALLLVAMLMVTRPVYLPALKRWHVACLVMLAIGVSVVVAFWPSGGAQAVSHEHDTGLMAGVCMGFGLLLGVPVYALLRLVDRGNALGSLVAAAAAGIAGNLVLKAHCAIESTGHVLLGHASVIVLFIVGLGLVHRWIPSK